MQTKAQHILRCSMSYVCNPPDRMHDPMALAIDEDHIISHSDNGVLSHLSGSTIEANKIIDMQ